MSKRQNTSRASAKAKIITPPLLLLFGVSTLAYYLTLAAIYALFGERLASWLANPLFGIAVFFIARWDGMRSHQSVSWREWIKFPQLRPRKLLVIILVIFLIQNIASFISVKYIEAVQPDLITDDFAESYYALFDLWGSLIIMLIAAVSSYFLGGYVAGKLSPQQYLAPYSHAAVGGFVVYLINSLTIQFLLICKCGTPPTQEDIGWFVVILPPIILLSLFGAWVGTRTRLLRSLDSVWRSIGAAGMAAALQLLRKAPTNSTDISPEHDDDSELSVSPISSAQPTVESGGSEDPKFKVFPQKQRHRKKHKRR